MTQQQTPSADDVLMGGGRPAAKFEHPGATVGGKILAPPRTHQEREYDRNNPGRGKPKVFPSGDPIYGITVDVQTNDRSLGAEDDGVRRIWIEGKRLKEAVREAVRAGGGTSLQQGGELWVKYTGDGEPPSAGANPPKLWDARYTPPTPGPVSQDQAWGPPPQQQQSAPPQQQPADAQGWGPPDPTDQGRPPADSPWGDEPPF
jgi:hypothetical protein